MLGEADGLLETDGRTDGLLEGVGRADAEGETEGDGEGAIGAAGTPGTTRTKAASACAGESCQVRPKSHDSAKTPVWALSGNDPAARSTFQSAE